MTHHIDSFLAKSFQYRINKTLGKSVSIKIEDILHDKYGVSLSEAIEKIQYLKDALFVLFGDASVKLISKAMKNLCEINLEFKDTININDEHLQEIFEKLLLDPTSKSIWKEITKTPQSLSELYLLDNINEKKQEIFDTTQKLIDDRILIPVNDGVIIKYHSIIKGFTIKFNNNTPILQITLNENINQSQLIQFI